MSTLQSIDQNPNDRSRLGRVKAAEPSQAKLQANRNNAQKSTGPRTPQGKLRSSQNALTHGLTSHHLTPRGDDLLAFPSLLHSLRSSWNPSSPAESTLLESLAALQLRLHRCARIETGLFDLHMPSITPSTPEETIHSSLALSFANQASSFSHLSRYEAALSRAYDRTLKQLLALRKERLTPVDAPLPTLVPDETNPPPIENKEPIPHTPQRRLGKPIPLPEPQRPTVSLNWEWADGRDEPHPLNDIPLPPRD